MKLDQWLQLHVWLIVFYLLESQHMRKVTTYVQLFFSLFDFFKADVYVVSTFFNIFIHFFLLIYLPTLFIYSLNATKLIQYTTFSTYFQHAHFYIKLNIKDLIYKSYQKVNSFYIREWQEIDMIKMIKYDQLIIFVKEK